MSHRRPLLVGMHLLENDINAVVVAAAAAPTSHEHLFAALSFALETGPEKETSCFRTRQLALLQLHEQIQGTFVADDAGMTLVKLALGQSAKENSCCCHKHLGWQAHLVL